MQKHRLIDASNPTILSVIDICQYLSVVCMPQEYFCPFVNSIHIALVLTIAVKGMKVK